MIVKFTEQEETFLEQQAKAIGITKEDVLHNLLQQSIEDAQEIVWEKQVVSEWENSDKKITGNLQQLKVELGINE